MNTDNQESGHEVAEPPSRPSLPDGEAPSGASTETSERKGSGGLPPLWKCVWRCLTHPTEWKKCQKISAAAVVLMNEDEDLGWELYALSMERWGRLLGIATEPRDQGDSPTGSDPSSATAATKRPD